MGEPHSEANKSVREQVHCQDAHQATLSATHLHCLLTCSLEGPPVLKQVLTQEIPSY